MSEVVGSGYTLGFGIEQVNDARRLAGEGLAGASEVLLDQRVLTATAASITFSNISQDYDQLRIEIIGRTAQATTLSAVVMYANGDTTDTNYGNQKHNVTDGSHDNTEVTDGAHIGWLVGDSALTDSYSMLEVRIPNYAGSYEKMAYSQNLYVEADDTDLGGGQRFWHWENTASITSLEFSSAVGNIAAGTIARLIGVKVGATAQVGGRTTIYDSGEITSTQSSFDIQNIPQKYDHLEVVMIGRSDDSNFSVGVSIALNGDTTAGNYRRTEVRSYSTTLNSAQADTRAIASVAAANATAGEAGQAKILIENYTNATFRKTLRTWLTYTEAATSFQYWDAHRWANTAAINRITLTMDAGNFIAGSRVIVYGIGGSAQIGSHPTNYIEGLKVAYNSASTVDIESGSCRDDTDSVDLTSDSTINVDITASGANGLDTGSEANSTWYYVWVIGKGDGTTAGLLSTSSTSPTMPSGYVYKRRVGSIRNNGSGNIIEFYQHSSGGARKVMYRNGIQSSGDLSITTTYQSLDLSSLIPPTASTGIYSVRVWNTAGGSVQTLILPNGDTESANNAFIWVNASTDGGGDRQTTSFEMPVGTGQIMRLASATGTNTTAVETLGFTEEIGGGTSTGNTDLTALHTDVASEIYGLDSGTVASTDQLVFEDADDSYNKKRTAALAVAQLLPSATTSAQGKIELATQTEADAATDSVRAVTPSTLGNVSKRITAKTTAYTVTNSDNNQVFTNSGASAQVEFTLPTAAAGLTYTFYAIDSDGIKITAASGDTIRVSTEVTIAAGSIESTAVGDSLTIVALDDTQWVVINGFIGTWTVETV
jgi:hypothetical protein